MTPEEIKELQDAAHAHGQHDVHAGRVMARIVEHLIAMDERLKKLETRKNAAKSGEGD